MGQTIYLDWAHFGGGEFDSDCDKNAWQIELGHHFICNVILAQSVIQFFMRLEEILVNSSHSYKPQNHAPKQNSAFRLGL
jgi:hypothetical protein